MAADDTTLHARLPAHRVAVTALIVCVGCYLGSRAGTILVFPTIGTAVLFFPYAILAAALILSPVRDWWLYVLAAAVGNLWPHLSHERSLNFVLMTELANVARALIAAGGIRWLAGRTDPFSTLRGVVVFVIFAVFVGPAAGALIGAIAVTLHNSGAEAFVRIWRAWFLSNMLTGLTVLSFILIVFTRGNVAVRRVPMWRMIEASAVAIGVLAVGEYILTRTHCRGMMPVGLFAPLPFLLWAAVRFGPGGMVPSLAATSALAIGGALNAGGPFIALSPTENLIQLQIFLTAVGIPLLLLSTLVWQQARTADALEQSQRNYRAIVEDQTELICRFLPDGTYTFVNDAYSRYFNTPPEQLLGRTFYQFIPPEQHQAVRKLIASITPDTPAAEQEHEVIAPNGEIRWQHWINRGAFDEQGRIVAYQAVGRDVTERKNAEVALRGALKELGQLKDRLQAENAYLKEELSASERMGDVICRSRIMRRTVAQAQRVAATDATVLILGETGVGKEVIARTIHQGSNRKDRPLVRVNCAALPTNLIESELFGHERGAFTGATNRRLGRFEVANDATLFLDEIGELPPESQSKLLRVLQENELERLGGSETIRVNVRVLAATSRDLSECVRLGTFRADLFFRLNVFPITVPPLRERSEDIVPLASVFLERIGKQLGRTFAPLSTSIAESLMRHRWPGNVRELEHVIERAAICSRGNVLELPEAWDVSIVPEPELPVTRGSSSDPVPKPRTMAVDPSKLLSIEALERQHIISVLQHTHWRIDGPAGAALILGMKPSTLRFRMKKLSISRIAASNAASHQASP